MLGIYTGSLSLLGNADSSSGDFQSIASLINASIVETVMPLNVLFIFKTGLPFS